MDFKNFVTKLFTWQEQTEYEFKLPENYNENKTVNTENLENTPKNIFPSLQVNLEYMKTRYNTLINSDIIIREFTLSARNRQYKAFLAFIDGMVDTDLINNYILKPLMLRNTANTYEGNEDRIISEAKTNNITVRKLKKFNLVDYISSSLLPQNSIQKDSIFDDIIIGINSGNCALFIDTLDIAFNIDVKGFKQRSIDTPQNEVVIKGPNEAFVENIRTNTSLLRRIINNENLIIQNTEIGNVTKTKCSICYIQDIANADLVAEAQYRLNNLQVDSVLSSGELEQLIVDNNHLSMPRILSTERPDTASRYLLQGRVVVILNGSPHALVLPATIIDFLSTPEDNNLKPAFSNFLKLLRFLAAIITLLLPGIYVAITSFHQEIFPTELLFSILSARANVPFPIIVEILLMEISFELIREASVRVPSPLGSTIGIVGALVIGEAVVSANIVSPTLIIIVAITAISASAVPDFSFSFHLRLYRFLFILLGYMAGFLGISLGLFVYISMVTDMNSFGISTTVPFAPYVKSKGNKLFLPPIWKREYRPTYLDPKSSKEQDNISMKWRN
jgi:spore germination protein KA